MLGKKLGTMRYTWTAPAKNDGPCSPHTGGHRPWRGVRCSSCREKIQLVLLEERRKVGGTVQQNGNLHLFSAAPRRASMSLLWGQEVLSKAQTVFGSWHGSWRWRFRHKRSGAELPPQQRNIIAQQSSVECLPRTAQVALAHRRVEIELGASPAPKTRRRAARRR